MSRPKVKQKIGNMSSTKNLAVVVTKYILTVIIVMTYIPLMYSDNDVRNISLMLIIFFNIK